MTTEQEKKIQDAMVTLHVNGLLSWRSDSGKEFAEVSFVKCADGKVAVANAGYKATKQALEESDARR
jgi:hypothetical protein